MWQAVLHFDAERGVAFSTYAVVAIQRRMWQVVVQAQRTVASFLSPEPVNALTLAEENLWQGQVEAALLEAVGRLPDCPRQVMVGRPPRSLATVGRAWGVSREAVRDWHNAALLLLRLPILGQRFSSNVGPPSFDPVSLGLAWLMARWRKV